MNVYIVEDCGNSPGKIYAVCADEDAADDLVDAINNNMITRAKVGIHKLHYGQVNLQECLK